MQELPNCVLNKYYAKCIYYLYLTGNFIPSRWTEYYKYELED